MHARILVFCASVCLALPATPLAAQETAGDTTQLQPLVITATRVAVPHTAALAATTVVTGEELRRQGITNVADALRLVPGGSIAPSGSFGGTTSLFLRGGERDYVRVLVDGVAINQPGGEVDFAHLTTDNIERIEVVRGPTSVLYGSDAVTGVVQIFTRRGARRTTIDAAARAGSWAAREGELSASGGSGMVRWSLGGGVRRTDGIFPFNSEYRNDVLSGSVAVDPDPRTDLRVTARFGDARFHYPTDATGKPVDSNAFRTERQLMVGVHAGRRLNDVLEARFLLGATQADLRNDDRPDGVNTGGYISRNRIGQQSAEARVNAYLSRGAVLSTGFEYRQQRDRNESVSIFEGEPYPVEPTAPQRFNRAVYGQLTGNLGERVSYSAGGRHDDNANFGEFLTYRLAAGVRALSRTTVRGAIGTAFKEPTIFENYGGGFVTGNPALEPERSRSWEIGLEQRMWQDAVVFAATWFDQRFRDRIEFVMDGDVATYANVGAARAQGLELEARVHPFEQLAVRASFSTLEARLIDAEGGEGERLLRRPRNSATLAMEYRPSAGAGVGAVLSRVGARHDIDFAAWPAVPVELPAYTRVDAHAALDVLRWGDGSIVGLTARVENVFDEEYQTIYGFRTPGRTLLAGVRLTVAR